MGESNSKSTTGIPIADFFIETGKQGVETIYNPAGLIYGDNSIENRVKGYAEDIEENIPFKGGGTMGKTQGLIGFSKPGSNPINQI